MVTKFLTVQYFHKHEFKDFWHLKELKYIMFKNRMQYAEDYQRKSVNQYIYLEFMLSVIPEAVRNQDDRVRVRLEFDSIPISMYCN